MHKVLVNRLGGLSLPRKRVVRLTDRPDMTLDVYPGCKTTMQHMVKGIVNVFDHMGFCLVLNLTTTCTCTDGKWAVAGNQFLLPVILVLLPTFTPGSKYLLPAKKVNF